MNQEIEPRDRDGDGRLDAQLRRLTEWRGPETALWRSALSETTATPVRSRFAIGSLRSVRIPRFAAAAMIAVVLAGVALWSLTGRVDLREDGSVRSIMESRVDAHPVYDIVASSPPPSPPMLYDGGSGGRSGERVDSARLQNPASIDAPPGETSLPVDARSVIQTTTIDLAVQDVRAAFLTAGSLVSAARGEYVEDSRLSGDGVDARATLKLRVRADRMSEILGRLRELGVVAGEQTVTDDVTNQVVDLDARLRNERRVEEELLALIDKRPDAPLKELLELRSRVADVRGAIERLVAQRQTIDRLISLSTIIVSLHPEVTEPEQSMTAPPLGAYFRETLHTSWNNALRTLAGALGFVIEVAIGGLPAWCIAFLLLLGVRGIWRRQLALGTM